MEDREALSFGQQRLSFGNRVIKKLSKRFHFLTSRILSEERAEKYKRKIQLMGDPPLSPHDIVTMQILCGVFFAILVFWLMRTIGWKGGWLYVGLLGGLLFGITFPLIYIQESIRKRHIQIQKALPFSLDLLTLAVEAGLDFGAALMKVVEKSPPGPLKEELNIMLNEIRMGKTREEAFRNLANRVDLPALTQFVSNIIQAERMGVSIGKVLRIQSTQLRIERMQRAEKLANEAPVKLLFPLIFCIFPTVFIILFAPIVFQFLE